MANLAYQESNVSPKRPKFSDEETCLDRISQLPDVLIQHILSFLPTKEAVATSVLSKRWLWVWTSVPILDLEDSLFCKTDERLRIDFMQFFTKVLIFNKVASLDKFCLKFNAVYHPWYVKTCFWAAVARDVKELDINIQGMENFPLLKLPCALFTAKTLHVLKLNHGIELDVPGTVSLPCLKVLHLVWIKCRRDESVSRLFCGCPVLQELLLKNLDCDNALNFNISIPTLKSLFISFFTGQVSCKLKINAPILQYLNLQANLPQLEYDVEDVSSLDEANVTVSLLGNHHIPLVKALCNAKFLSFNWDWYTIMHNFKTYPLFLNLVRLELNVGYGGWSVLSRFLESSHNLKVLVLAKNANCRGLGLECRWTPPKYVPKCLPSSLTMVYFRGFEGLRYQLSMVKYILNNAGVLKMMDICTNGISDMPMDSKFDMLRKLSMFPRGSKACQLQFN
ncbi:F-box/FBD/LRR-repeat protein At4g26340-like [Durio zibethinus]|uniref:F-box/FBD/LRR-repeat protein At4g26340-like n=1 Tax=Durio zibethinus TaxID=66656 RepID=A0A6P5WNZ3_DURZI|nr:F-box/FBD/LRR-repeat protein At4g26340-like [Durio zibethinus]